MKFRQALANYEIPWDAESSFRHPIAEEILFLKSWKTGEEVCEVNPIAVELEEKLEHLGLREFEPLDHGKDSVVVAAGDKVVSVRRDLPRREESDLMQQPLHSGIVGPRAQFGYEIRERLDTASITNRDVLEMALRCKEAGYLFRDAGRDNLGRRKDGTVLILDAGCLQRNPVEIVEKEFPALMERLRRDFPVSDEESAAITAAVAQSHQPVTAKKAVMVTAGSKL